MCVAICGLIASLFLRNVRLPETQSLEDDEGHPVPGTDKYVQGSGAPRPM